MAHNDLAGNVIGEIWRGHDAATEQVFFLVQGNPNWFRIDYTGPLMVERANYITQRLKAAAATPGIDVGVDYDELTVNGVLFHLVSFIEVRA